MRQFRTINEPANCNNNGTCEYGEDTVSCPNDCDAVSGARCGNGLCEAGDGENCLTCAADCAGKQKGSASNQFCCGNGGNNPLGCGRRTDGSESCVDASKGRACRLGAVPLAQCGDGLCEGAETESSCPADCAPPPAACQPTEPAEVSCFDGLDNDCDGLTDGNDPDCQTGVVCTDIGDRTSCRNAGCQWKKNTCINP